MQLGRSGGPVGYARIVIEEPEIDSDGKPYIPISYHFPVGTGDSIDENSALVKPFRSILEDGKPVGQIVFVFYQENDTDFVLGSFVNTVGNRILFFPGLRLSRVTHTPDGIDLRLEDLHNVDHFTLEKENLTDWHLTLLQKKEKGTRYGRLQTKKIGHKTFLWFLMALQRATQLESMPNKQRYWLTV